MANDYQISVGVTADFSDLKTEAAQGSAAIDDFAAQNKAAAAELKAAQAAWDDAFAALGKSAAAGSAQAAAALKEYADALTAAKAKVTQLAEAKALDVEASRAVAAANRELSSQTQIASMNMRVLEGSTMGAARAAGMFAAQTLGLGSALGSSMAASVFGAIALGMIVVDLGEKIYDAFDIGGKQAEKLREESLKLTNSMRLQNAEMHVALDRELRAKAISDGKPFNGLALSADEARVAVLRLNQELATSADRMLKQLQDEAGTGLTGAIARMIGTRGGTGYEQTMVRQHQIHMSEAATADYSTGTNTMSHQLSESESYGKALQARQRELQWRTGPGYGAESPAALPGLRDELRSVTELVQAQKLEEDDLRTAIAQAKNEPSHAHNPSTKGSKGSDPAVAQMRADETALADQKRAGAMSVEEEIAFWQKRLSAYQHGSAQYLQVENRLNELSKQAQREEAQTRNQFVEESIQQYKKKQAESERINEEIEAARQADLSRETSDAEVTAESAQVQIESAAKVGAARIQYEEATGAISKHTAALQLGALHAKEYADRLAALKKELKELQDEEAQGANTTTQQRSVQNQITQVQGEAQAAAYSDAAAATGKKGASQWGQTWTDTFQNTTASFSGAMGTWLTISDGYNTQFSVLMGRMMVQVVQQFTQQMIQMGIQWGIHEALLTTVHLAGIQTRQAADALSNSTLLAELMAKLGWHIGHEAVVTGTHVTANATKTASDATAAATTAAIQSASNVAQTISYTSVAAMGAASSVAFIPVVGPALAAAAAAAMTALGAGYTAMAAFEKGGIIPGSIGSAVPILGHAGEAVLPQPLTAMLMQTAQGGGGGAANFTYAPNISAIDGASVAGMTRQHSAVFMREATRQMRRMNKI